ncbi:hypothetical protein AKJ57_06250 [candidate division MSBL1 archaeon SCGC-AAA259A05]|uniref:ArnR1-like winged helix-turn-helix domain-containing protein n=1 Tax=candidate division MSBL1 archaeon SCGC-AAA259A05 TaxID=1698259 RepID=A0A133U3S7_9EURY|nr:hypothetical protein AKJ57_06250 [candidate division MSBL1 archaeon SCGC-AAA259A05]
MPEGRRSRLDIYASVLRAVKDASRKTHIVYEAKLNFKRCQEYLSELKENGLVKIESQSPLTWVITEDGEQFLDKYEQVRELIPR